MTNIVKNMSEKEKAKRYEEALEEAKKWHKAFVAGQNYSATDIKVSYEWIFPELKELESEGIRKAIIHFISHTPTVPKGVINKEQMLTWLEKHGEQKPLEWHFDFEKKELRKIEQKPADKVIIQEDKQYKELCSEK